jgi:hypothetical protein
MRPTRVKRRPPRRTPGARSGFRGERATTARAWTSVGGVVRRDVDARREARPVPGTAVGHRRKPLHEASGLTRPVCLTRVAWEGLESSTSAQRGARYETSSGNAALLPLRSTISWPRLGSAREASTPRLAISARRSWESSETIRGSRWKRCGCDARPHPALSRLSAPYCSPTFGHEAAS